MRILVVDDDRAVRESLRRSLAFNGYQVELAADGHAALDAVAAQRPDAMVLDVMMPRLDGLEVCRRLRGSGDDLPILVLTARDAVSDRVAGLDAGADDYLPKPFALEELLARLRALLRRRTPDETGAGRPGKRCSSPTSARPGDPRGAPRRAPDQPHPHRVRAAGAAAGQPAPGAHPGRDPGAGLGLRLPDPGNALEVYVGYLRRKTEADGEPRLIHTVRGIGYVLRDTPP